MQESLPVTVVLDASAAATDVHDALQPSLFDSHQGASSLYATLPALHDGSLAVAELPAFGLDPETEELNPEPQETGENQLNELLAISVMSGEGAETRAIEALQNDDPEYVALLRQAGNLPAFGSDTLVFRMWSIRVLEGRFGPIKGWPELEGKDAELTRPFLEKRDISVLATRNAVIRYQKKFTHQEKAGSLKRESAEALFDELEQEVIDAFRPALAAFTDESTRRDIGGIIWSYLSSDLKQYARKFTKIEAGKIIQTDAHFAESVYAYAENISRIGLENVRLLRQELGIVNFQRYSEHQLLFALDVVNRRPEALEMIAANGLSLMISGVDGDHNGAFIGLGRNAPLQDMNILPCELEKLHDINRLHTFLGDREIRSIARLTIAGHGSRNGVDIASKLVLRDSENDARPPSDVSQIGHDSPYMQRLYDRMQPGGSIVLISCSQAKKFQGSKRSMVDGIAMARPGVEVTGSVSDSYTSERALWDNKPLDEGVVAMGALTRLGRLCIPDDENTPKRIFGRPVRHNLGFSPDYLIRPVAQTVVAVHDQKHGLKLVRHKPKYGEVRIAA